MLSIDDAAARSLFEKIMSQIDYIATKKRDDGTLFLTLDGYAEITEEDDELFDSIMAEYLARTEVKS